MIGWRSYVGIAAVGVFCVMIFLIYYYQGQASRGKETTHAEHQQAENNAQSAKTIDHYTQSTTIIRDNADAAAATIQAASGGDAPIPYAVLNSWRDGINGMRKQPPATNNPTP